MTFYNYFKNKTSLK
ncbi:hypothetical protein ACFX18_05135 [Lactococcus garvieae]